MSKEQSPFNSLHKDFIGLLAACKRKGLYNSWLMHICRKDLPLTMMLERLIYWFSPGKDGSPRVRVIRDGKYWLAKSDHEWDDARLSRKQVKRAKVLLRRYGIIEYHSRMFAGIRMTHYTLDLDKLTENLKDFLSTDVNRGVEVPEGPTDESHRDHPTGPSGTSPIHLPSTDSINNILSKQKISSPGGGKPEKVGAQASGDAGATDSDSRQENQARDATASDSTTPSAKGKQLRDKIHRFMLSHLNVHWRQSHDGQRDIVRKGEPVDADVGKLPPQTHDVTWLLLEWAADHNKELRKAPRIYRDNIDDIVHLYLGLSDTRKKDLRRIMLKALRIAAESPPDGFDPQFHVRRYASSLGSFCRHFDTIIKEMEWEWPVEYKPYTEEELREREEKYQRQAREHSKAMHEARMAYQRKLLREKNATTPRKAPAVPPTPKKIKMKKKIRNYEAPRKDVSLLEDLRIPDFDF